MLIHIIICQVGFWKLITLRGFQLESMEIQSLLELQKHAILFYQLCLCPSVSKQTDKASDVREDVQREAL